MLGVQWEVEASLVLKVPYSPVIKSDVIITMIGHYNGPFKIKVIPICFAGELALNIGSVGTGRSEMIMILIIMVTQIISQIKKNTKFTPCWQ